MARRSFRILGVAVVIAVALGLRFVAVDRLSIDFDEDDYVRAAQLYADGLRHGDAGILLRENYRPEHPPLTKIVTATAFVTLPPAPLVPDRPTTADPASSLPEPQLTVARGVQAVLGTLAVAGIAVLDPVAGLLLALNTWTIKYTSEVMLEALPAMLSVLMVVAYLRAGRRRVRLGVTASCRSVRWMAVAAIAFGLACASKYPYGIVGATVVADWAWSTRPRPLVERGSRPGGLSVAGAGVVDWLRPKIGWLLLAAAAFALADPYLWPDPLGRLSSSLAFHLGYTQGEAVRSVGYPIWQPVTWLLGSVPWDGAAFVVSVDISIAFLAAFGLGRTFRRQRVIALWLVVGLGLLFLWPTKWPQYVLMITPPLSVAAAEGLRRLLAPVATSLHRLRESRTQRRLNRVDVRRGLRDLRTAAPWLAPGLVAALLLGIVPLLYELAMSMTDLSAASLRDGIGGGVVRAVVGGVTGSVPAIPFDTSGLSPLVHFVGGDLLGKLLNGVWLGGNTTAQFPAFSLVWTTLAVSLQTILGVAVAIALAPRRIRFRSAWQVLFILPWAIPEFVGAVAWWNIVAPDGGWVSLLFGTQIPWQGSAELSLLVLVIAGVWIGWPLMMLVALAGLGTIPRTTLEAAALDGATGWTRFRRVTLPMLMPLLAPVLVIRAIGAFNQFYLFYVLRPTESAMTSATWSYYVFDSTSGAGLYAVSAALNIVTLVLIGIVVVWFFRWRARAERVAFA